MNGASSPEDDNAMFRSDVPLTMSEESKPDQNNYPSSASEKAERPPSDRPRSKKIKELLSNWRHVVLILAPLLYLPVIYLIDDPANVEPGKERAIQKCAYVLLLMATYWCTEAIPLAATALMPIFLIPMLGLLPAKVVSPNYLKDLNFLFVGGLMFAVAVERWNLHKRIALGVLVIVGTRPKMLLLGLTLVTGILSMWLSNTATTAMMIPIGHAVLMELWKQTKYAVEPSDESYGMKKSKHKLEREDGADDDIQNGDAKIVPAIEDISPKDMSPAFQNLGKAISLSICQAANIGGIGTLIGTAPNIVLSGLMERKFPLSTSDTVSPGISFATWMVYSFPLMMICLAISWLVLVFIFLGPKSLFMCKDDPEFHKSGGKGFIRREYKKLGPVSFPEIVMIVFFIILVILWMSRRTIEPTIPGWALKVFGSETEVSDSSTVLFICLFLFAFPSSFPGMSRHTTGWKLGEPLLNWESVQKKLPWGVIILLGGGFALADVCEKSGLSAWLGCKIGTLSDIPPAAFVFICGAIMTFFTEFTSNTSSANIFLPILANLALKIEMHPLLLLLPVTICASFAFALPVATPPNAIVFSYGHLRVIDMVKSGLLMNVLCLLASMMAIFTWGTAYYNLNEFPAWANVTADAVNC